MTHSRARAAAFLLASTAILQGHEATNILVSDIHFHPAEPRNFRFGAAVRL